jgi:hypothetical protein
MSKLETLVEWDHPPIPFKSPSILYDIHWFLNDCNNVYDSSPECHKTPEHHANTVSFRSDDKVYVKIGENTTKENKIKQYACCKI